jgi:hypothetical protein
MFPDQPEEGGLCQSRIVKFLRAQPIVHDCVEDAARKLTRSVARYRKTKTEQIMISDRLCPSSALTVVEAPCPLSLDGGMCPTEDLVWECDTCGKTIEFDKDAITIDERQVRILSCIKKIII